MIYLIDANIIITPENDYYCHTFHPGFWDFLQKYIQTGEIIIIKNVYDELVKGRDDYISNYLKGLKNQGILEVKECGDTETQENFVEISSLVQENNIYSIANKEFFLSGADPWLIAKAKTLNATVVTFEIIVDETSKVIKIPNICNKVNVNYINLKTLMEKLSPKFILE
ncbi:MAG: DUF4411 family protein [Campylobacteraceae bacterium]|jgi:hypothetical protein|nr:DUF4411 family protein [Campylobacteraceae bacterium]